jgi:mono/diheme cytochrome c family protein
LRPFILGFVVALLVVALAIYGAVMTGAVPARGDTQLSSMEKWAAHTSLDATIAREAQASPYPYGPPTEADFVAGAILYVQNCAVCHGTGHSTPTAIARGFAVHAPQFAKHGVDDDPEGETYWKVEHGIRFTGMPAFDKTLDEKSIWQVTYFLKHLPALPARAHAIFDDPKLAPPPTPGPALSPAPEAHA